MSQYLYKVQQRNRLQQKGVLKRFSLQCIGKQDTLEDMRNEKTKMFEMLKGNRGTREYEEWFLKYAPGVKEEKKVKKKKNRRKKIKKSDKTKKKGRGKKTKKSDKTKKRKKKGTWFGGNGKTMKKRKKSPTGNR